MLVKQCKSCSRNVRDSNRYWIDLFIYIRKVMWGSSKYFGVTLNHRGLREVTICRPALLKLCSLEEHGRFYSGGTSWQLR